MARPRRKKADTPPPPTPSVRPVVLTGPQLHALGSAVMAFYEAERQSWIDKGYSPRWSEDWSKSVCAPAVEAYEQINEAFDGAFE